MVVEDSDDGAVVGHDDLALYGAGLVIALTGLVRLPVEAVERLTEDVVVLVVSVSFVTSTEVLRRYDVCLLYTSPSPRD